MITTVIQGGLIIAIGLIFAAKGVRGLNAFLNYGKTLKGRLVMGQQKNTISIAKPLLHVYVAKSYFTHFYGWAVVLSVLNLAILFFPSFCTGLIGQIVTSKYGSLLVITQKYSFNQLDGQTTVLLSIAILIHTSRRLYECVYVSEFSPNSKLNISHYLVGIFFYSALNMAVFSSIISNVHSGETHQIAFSGYFTTLNCILLAAFLFVQRDQFKHHYILKNTQKYNHPQERLFQWVSSPHYFDETLLYLIMNLIIAVNNSKSRWNLSFAAIELWVLVNLSTSALNTHEFYKTEKHQNDKAFIAPYAIFPYIL